MVNDVDLEKKFVIEKDKLALKYKQLLNNIEQAYNTSFDIVNSADHQIQFITFLNLDYNNELKNISIRYNNALKKIDYINYQFTDMKTVRKLNHKKFYSALYDKYKLELIISEINNVNEKYIQDLNEINNVYRDNIN